MLGGGCAQRTLRITQDPRVNTAVKDLGEPLEINIVCVYPKDVEKNPDLDPVRRAGPITADTWYARRPTGENSDGQHFQLPRNQIHLLTNETSYYGILEGPALRGRDLDGQVVVRSFDVKPGLILRNRHSAIYVFPKFFKEKSGALLPVPPVVFSPPAKFGTALQVHVKAQGIEHGRGAAADSPPRR
jgi:hypothetical protein